MALSVQKHNSQVTKNHEIMKRPISVLYMGEQEVAFRGHDESARSQNRGNFIELENAR